MSEVIIADAVASISDFKKDPITTLDAAKGFPVALLDRKQPVFYCIPAATYKTLMDTLEDFELEQIIKKEQLKRVKWLR